MKGVDLVERDAVTRHQRLIAELDFPRSRFYDADRDMKKQLFMLMLTLAASCAVREKVGPPPKPVEPAVCVLTPLAADSSADASLMLLRETFPHADFVSQVEAGKAFAESRAQNRVLIVPNVRNFPVNLWQPLVEHLHAGGPTILLGCDPLESRVRVIDGRPQTEAELIAQLIATARRSERLPSPQQWRHENESGKERGILRAAPWEAASAAEVEVEDFRDWDALVFGDIVGNAFAGANSIVFYARGDATTSRLAVICAEQDGSHWYCVVPLTTQWQPHVLHEAKFEYFYGGWNRGKPGDHLSLTKVRRMSFGLSMCLGAQAPGTHMFGVSEIRLADDPRSVAEVIDWPGIPLVSPPYRHYDLAVGNQRLQSPLARARGDDAPYLWLPLATTRDKAGVALGWPAALYFEPPARRHAWIAMEPTAQNGRVIAGLLREAVARLQSNAAPAPLPRVEPPPPRADDWMTTDAGYFSYRGKHVFLRGINYWPLSHNGKAPGEFNVHWLEASVFDPEIIRRDLDRLREVGINAVSIQYHAESQAPQLRYFVNECRQRGIWVHAFVGYLQPLDQDLALAQRLVEAAQLWNEPGIFAIDVAWEPHLGTYEGRCRFDTDWEAWLVEQYGSVEHAEEVIGRPLWIRNGTVTGPTDEELRTDGRHRVAVAVYRRFVDDYMSRRYGEVERLVRRLGCKQLLSARTGYGGTGNPWADPQFPIDLASGAVHFDFTSPEGYGLTGDRDQFDEAGFLTAYARGVSGGKPVAWLEFGCNVGRDPSPVDLANQARLYRNMFELAARSRAAAVFGWWYPSGWRVDERSDMGVINPDSTWRPVGDEYRQFAQRVGDNLVPPLPWHGRVIDRDADARGLSALWNRWRDTYRRETRDNRMEEVRPTGFDKLTSELPAISVGGVPFKAPAPLAYINAEWGQVQRHAKVGEPVRLELINTGPATWDKVTVAGQVVARTAYSERVWITWTPTAAGKTKLRPALAGNIEFGEPLEIEITP